MPRSPGKDGIDKEACTIALIGNCMSWAKHRRRKAAAKLHLRLDLQTFLPACAIVELDGKKSVMFFITNNTAWAACSVGAFYKSRWGIGVFFKQIKQTLRISDFLGNSKRTDSLAALGGAVAIPVAASPWSAIQLAAQLQPTVHHSARTAMG